MPLITHACVTLFSHRLSSRLDGTAGKLKSMALQRGVAKQLGAVSQQMGVAMAGMNTMQVSPLVPALALTRALALREEW